MYIKKRHKKSFLNIFISATTLVWVAYFMVFADNFKVENRHYWVNASFLSIKESTDEWFIQFSNIIVWDFSDRFTYIVQPWDSLSMIAFRFSTTVSNIKKVNWLNSDTIRAWQRLTISQQEWIIFEVKENSQLNDFASKYKLDLESLMSINYITDKDHQLNKWTEIFIPISNERAIEVWLIQRQAVIQQPTAPQVRTTNTTQSWWNWTIISRRYYNPQVNNWFAAWHCTWYVADKLFRERRPWWGNAKDWYNNARAAWYSVWQTPRIGSIIVIRYWAWYWSSYWHVWIVLDIDWNKNQVLIEEMNYSWRFIVTQRWVPMDNRITWYIYY